MILPISGNRRFLICRKPIKHQQLIRDLLDAVLLPKRLVNVECLWFWLGFLVNVGVDPAAKQVAISSISVVHQCVSARPPGSVAFHFVTSMALDQESLCLAGAWLVASPQWLICLPPSASPCFDWYGTQIKSCWKRRDKWDIIRSFSRTMWDALQTAGKASWATNFPSAN